MARSIETIYDQIITRVRAALSIPDTQALSATSLEGMVAYAFAYCTHILEQVFDMHRAEVNQALLDLKPHTARWYEQRVREFRYGYEFNETLGAYSDAGLTPDQITESQIVAAAAVVEQGDRLRIKVAQSGSVGLEPIPADRLVALRSYIARRKDAGVFVQLDSQPPDALKLTLDVYIDPLLYSADGTLIAQGGEPVREAVKQYIQSIPFNGVFALALLVDELQRLEGVVIPEVILAQYRFGVLPFTAISALVTPDSGYLAFETEQDLVLNYIFQNPIQ